jgi:membrane protein implicated in regulation of membrane protease activity
MIATITSMGAWGWIIAGVILLAVELAVPGAFMMWLGLAALLVGLLSFVIGWSWQAQGIAFAVLALCSVPLWRRFARRVEPEPGSPFLNRRTQELIGRVFTLDTPIVDGTGTVRIGDTIWRVNGPDGPSGSRVRVVAVDGANLKVEPAA